MNPTMTTPTLYYSVIVFSACALIGFVLAYLIVRMRRSEKIGLGDGDNRRLRQRMRTQANFLENLLPFSLLYLIYEINGGVEMILIVTGFLFVLARILHPLGLLNSPGVSFGRYYGTLITWLVIAFLAGANIYLIL